MGYDDDERGEASTSSMVSSLLSSTVQTPTFNNTKHNMNFANIRFTVGILDLIYFIIGTPTNLLVLIMCWNLARNVNSRNFNQYFVLSMTLADLLTVGIHSPLVFMQYTLHQKFDTTTCLTLYLTTYISTTVSSLSLLCLNVDKFIYLMKPLHYFLIVTKRRVLLSICAVWVTAVFLSMLLAFGPGTKYTPPCDFSTAHIGLYAFFFILCFVLPVCISFVLSVLIASLAIKARRARQHRLSRYSQDSNSIRVGGNRLAHLRSVMFVFSTTVWSAATCMPYRISYIIYKTTKLYSNSTIISVFYILLALLSSNPVGNPMITVITQFQYMSLLKTWIRKFTGKLGSRARANSKFSTTGMTLVTQTTLSAQNTPDGNRKTDEHFFQK